MQNFSPKKLLILATILPISFIFAHCDREESRAEHPPFYD